MIGPQPARDDEAVGRWLAERHRDLVNDLTDTLDLDAGLRDIGIAADHRAMVSDLSDLLDLDAGLAAILPAPEHLESRATPQSPSGPSFVGMSSTDLVSALAAAPVAVRLALRALALDLAQVVDVCETLDQVRERVEILMPHLFMSNETETIGHDLAPDDYLSRARDLSRALSRAHHRARSLSRDLSGDLSEAIARAHHLAETIVWRLGFNQSLTFTHNLNYALNCATTFSHPESFARRIIRGIIFIIADDLGIPQMEIDQVEVSNTQRLRDVVNNAIGADLHNVDLEGMHLDGVRWSEATRWPTRWIDHIRQNSMNLGNGIYEYRPGSSTADDGLVLASR